MHATDEPPSILSSTPGRIRLGLAGLYAETPNLEALRTGLVRLNGVTRVETNDLTKNVLVHYEPSAISSDSVVDAVRTIQRKLIPDAAPAQPQPPSMRSGRRTAARPRLLADSASLVSVALAVVAAESPLHLALAAVDAIKLVASFSEGRQS